MVRLSTGAELDTGDCTRHQCGPADVKPVSDALGQGLQITIHHFAAGGPELRQSFWLYDRLPSVFVRLDVVSPAPVASNHVAPLVLDPGRVANAGFHLDAGDRPRALFVPFDNDDFVRYNSGSATESYEVTALYDNVSRHGFVLGSVSHDTWKTGFTIGEPGLRSVPRLTAYGGATGRWTHDVEPHGMVSGTTISSPRLMVGYFADWRQGLEAFGAANARLSPPLRWKGGVPFGWNSWAAYETRIDYDKYLAASHFIRDHLQSRGFSNHGQVYINLDSFWDRLSEAQLRMAVRAIHAAGQKAGIYWTPFAWWGDNQAQPVEGTGGRFTYGELLLRDSHGVPVRRNQGGKAMDPSHPGTLLRIDYQLKQFVDCCFDFVKLDFLNYGALEGVHHDPHVTTGIAAYNLGMKRVVDDLNPARIGRPFFISLSIAPLFPAGYGHSRRISCDTFGKISNTEYMLNSLTYGWWANGALYPYNDPDHIVLKESDQEARTRVNSAAITGTVMLDSDDLLNPLLQQRASQFLTNPDINNLARSGRAFLPVEGDTGDHAADLFVRRESSTRCYLAVFNFGDSAVTRQVDLSRIGLDTRASYRARDLWTKQQRTIRQVLQLELAPHESTILYLF